MARWCRRHHGGVRAPELGCRAEGHSEAIRAGFQSWDAEMAFVPWRSGRDSRAGMQRWRSFSRPSAYPTDRRSGRHSREERRARLPGQFQRRGPARAPPLNLVTDIDIRVEKVADRKRFLLPGAASCRDTDPKEGGIGAQFPGNAPPCAASGTFRVLAIPFFRRPAQVERTRSRSRRVWRSWSILQRAKPAKNALDAPRIARNAGIKVPWRAPKAQFHDRRTIVGRGGHRQTRVRSRRRRPPSRLAP